jgi:hypothetical protein
MSDVIFRRFIPIGTTEDMDKFTALLVEKNITRDDLLLILRSVKLNSGAVVDQNGEQNG